MTVDDAAAAQEMTRHLIGLGHRRIAFIRGPLSQAASRHRLEGFQRAMAAAGLVVEPELLVDGDFTYRSGLDAAERLLAQAQAPTAIFAANDDMAAASVAVAHQRGLHVPGDLSVVGFDDTAIATTVWPELTTIRQPIAEMSCRALQILVEQIHDQVNRHLISPENVVLGHSLVRRQSDAAPSAPDRAGLRRHGARHPDPAPSAASAMRLIGSFVLRLFSGLVAALLISAQPCRRRLSTLAALRRLAPNRRLRRSAGRPAALLPPRPVRWRRRLPRSWNVASPA